MTDQPEAVEPVAEEENVIMGAPEGTQEHPVAVVCGVFRSGTTWVTELLGRMVGVPPLQEPFNIIGIGKHVDGKWDASMRMGALMAFERGLYNHWPGRNDPVTNADQRELLKRLHAGLVRQRDWVGVVKFMAMVRPEYWNLLGEDVRVVIVERDPTTWLSSCIRSANWWPVEVACRIPGPWHDQAKAIMDPADKCYRLLVTALLREVQHQFYLDKVAEAGLLHTVVDYGTLQSAWDFEVPRLAEFMGYPVLAEKVAHELVQVPFRTWVNRPWTRSDVLRVVDILSGR